jgi:hypothetical protein
LTLEDICPSLHFLAIRELGIRGELFHQGILGSTSEDFSSHSNIEEHVELDLNIGEKLKQSGLPIYQR